MHNDALVQADAYQAGSSSHHARDGHNALGEQLEDSYHQLTTRHSSQEPRATPRATHEVNRRATTASSELRESKAVKTYGAKASRDAAGVFGQSEDEDDIRPRKRHKSGNHTVTADLKHQSSGQNGAMESDYAAGRVEAMLNNYHGAEDLMSGNLSLGSFPSIHTSVQTSMTTPKTPRHADGRGPLKSQQSTIPTVADTAPGASTGERLTGSTESRISRDTISDASLPPHIPEEFPEPTTTDPRIRPQATPGHDACRDEALKPSASQRSTCSIVREHSPEIHDELASTASKPTASKAKRKASETKQPEGNPTRHLDELGSDEIAVGLPVEHYQPRPSRSRSNRNDEDLLIPENFSKRPEALVKKKKASKRRKTTALAQPSPKVEIEEDDEEDQDIHLSFTRKTDKANKDIEPVVLIPTEPPNPDKEEAEQKDQTDGPIEDEEPFREEPPTHENLPPSSPPKKKRGRPRKQASEPAALETPTDPDDEDLPSLQDLPKPTTKPGRKKRKPKETTPTILNDDDDGDSPSETPQLEDDGANTHLSQSQGNRQPITTKSKASKNLKEIDPAQVSPAKLTTPPETPRKSSANKGPDKHSPLNSGKVKYRVGLSKRARIEPLLKIVRK